MAANENYSGESVYTSVPIEERSESPLYSAVCELVQRHSVTNRVLDVGCSDGVATLGLPGYYQVFGVDLSHAALKGNRNQHTVRADMRQLPISPDAGIDTVLMLDVVEHESYDESMMVLAGMKDILAREHTLIVNMPIISPLSLETWRELIEMAKNRERPEAGLFDRTHQILKPRKGHYRLFRDAGYDVVEDYQTNKLEGITGLWPFKGPADFKEWKELADSEGFQRAFKLGQLMLHPVYGGRRNLLYDEAIRAYYKSQLSDSEQVSRLGRAMVAYQGLYVLKPVYR